MVVIVVTFLFPHAKSPQVAKKNIEMIQKYPSDPSISKTACLAANPTLDGMKVLAMIEVAKGKVSEAIDRLGKQYQEFALEIEGLKYQMETYMSIAEAYKLLSMEPPPED